MKMVIVVNIFKKAFFMKILSKQGVSLIILFVFLLIFSVPTQSHAEKHSFTRFSKKYNANMTTKQYFNYPSHKQMHILMQIIFDYAENDIFTKKAAIDYVDIMKKFVSKHSKYMDKMILSTFQQILTEEGTLK